MKLKTILILSLIINIIFFSHIININANKLITNNNELLNTLSNYTRDKLRTNKKITDISMLYEGTKPTKENFNNFIFSKNGLIIYFPQYQIAPYSQGEFNVIIPYNILFKNMTFYTF